MPTMWEIVAQKFEEPEPVDPATLEFDTPGHLAQHINPRTVQTPALDLIDEALVRLRTTPDLRLIITMAPQEGKSTRVAQDLPIWVLHENPDTRIICASYGQGLANRNGRAIRNRIIAHPELGLQIASDNGAASEWEIEGHIGGVYSVGILGGITGRACDFMIIDDPIKSRAEADSKVYRDRVWDWWTDEASARLAPGAPVVLILTRWHHDDLAGRLLAEEDSDWEVINIPAQADHDPEQGETDPLGREVGEFMESARQRTQEQWELRKKTAGTRTWSSLYQGHPTPDTGNLFPLDGWARYTKPLHLVRPDGSHWIPLRRNEDWELVQSWDLAFKDQESSDYVCGQIWLRHGVSAYLLDMVHGQFGFTETCQAMKDLTAKWPQATAKLVEDKANGPAVMNALRTQVGGMIPVNPEGSKYARAVAITPLTEAKNVVLPDPQYVPGTAWVVKLTDEARDFPSATHDDTVDAMTQGVHRLLLVDILEEDVHDLDELLADGEESLGWAVSY